MSTTSASSSGRDPALVVERGGDGLELEGDVGEALRPGGRLQLVLRGLVGGIVLVDEADRPAEHHVAQRHGRLARRLRPLRLGLELFPQMREEPADQLDEGQPHAPDLRRLLHQRGAEHRFQRPHEPTLGAVDIFEDGGAAEIGLAVFQGEEQRRGQGRRLALDRQKPRPGIVAAPRPGKAERGIGGAEIEAGEGSKHDGALGVGREPFPGAPAPKAARRSAGGIGRCEKRKTSGHRPGGRRLYPIAAGI